MKAIHKEFYWKSFLTTRRRSTQFKSNYKTIIWSCYKREFRERLVELGMPKENKSITADIPNCKYNIPAFWRGFLDGDGSIGMTRNNEPFISVTIRSEKLAKKYLKMLRERFNIIKILNPNKRDNVYNVVVKNEDAINLGSYIYRDSGIHLQRKYKKFKEIKKWKRTKPKINARTWTPEEDAIILNHSVEDSMRLLDRTEKSVKMRLWRLKQCDNPCR